MCDSDPTLQWSLPPASTGRRHVSLFVGRGHGSEKSWISVNLMIPGSSNPRRSFLRRRPPPQPIELDPGSGSSPPDFGCGTEQAA
ncbi:MAG: hypothetical protein CMJ27_01535 [Phycisphaerae bacterium]|nr:hypothetical protein [Phycisphaerae bacterium]OUX03147.1 MAG: hypothetical protein CBD91_00975 [Phycisphaeraceae bacterium TMED231]